jgi:hypothetical protein
MAVTVLNVWRKRLERSSPTASQWWELTSFMNNSELALVEKLRDQWDNTPTETDATTEHPQMVQAQQVFMLYWAQHAAVGSREIHRVG